VKNVISWASAHCLLHSRGLMAVLVVCTACVDTDQAKAASTACAHDCMIMLALLCSTLSAEPQLITCYTAEPAWLCW
jgi:hypothetical protein